MPGKPIVVLQWAVICSFRETYGTFTFYLKKSLNRHSPASAVFGVFYAFSAYFLAYFWNIMWLDGMIILPLLVLGIENLINKGSGKLYLFSLVYILYSSYYMGYMLSLIHISEPTRRS